MRAMQQPVRLLIVDDDPGILKLLGHIIEACGYRCSTAADVEAARRLLGTRTFDLLITDIRMPGESGIDLIRFVKEAHPDMAVVIVSVIDDPQEAQLILSMGVYGYITKPFDKHQALITINNALVRKQLETNLSDREQRERELRMSEEKNRTIVENIGMGVALISPQMKIMEMNSKMQQWFPEITADGKSHCYRSFTRIPRDTPCSRCPTVKTLADGKVHEMVKQITLADGKRDLKIISSPIIDNDGKVVAAIELLNDITEELTMERELQQSQKLASIGQLAAGVAHEINNPTGFVSSNLGSLRGYQGDIGKLIDLYHELKKAIRDGDQSLCADHVTDQIERIEAVEQEIDLDFIREDIVDLIDESKEGTERIKKIVEDLKHFAHPGQDKIQDTDINKELTSTLNIVNNELKYKACVVKEFNPLPIIMANPQQLNQVFINILVNAAQSIEKMGEIRIMTKAVDGHVQIHISDTGCGISEENLTKIFDPFFTTKGVGKGTGLGMNIAYNIIQKHRGDIQVESRVGEGTTFIITLPVEGPGDDGPENDVAAQACIPSSTSDHQTAPQV